MALPSMISTVAYIHTAVWRPARLQWEQPQLTASRCRSQSEASILKQRQSADYLDLQSTQNTGLHLNMDGLKAMIFGTLEVTRLSASFRESVLRSENPTRPLNRSLSRPQPKSGTASGLICILFYESKYCFYMLGALGCGVGPLNSKLG